MAKSGAQRSREYRERKRACQPPRIRLPPKTGAQRAREYRARKKARKMSAVTGTAVSPNAMSSVFNLEMIPREVWKYAFASAEMSRCASQPYINFKFNRSDRGGSHDPTTAGWENFCSTIERVKTDNSSEEAWVEKLIATIEEKPALYDRSVLEHSDRRLVNQLWMEVCETMMPGWHDLTLEEQILKGREMKELWRSLKTSFRREFINQRFEDVNERSIKQGKYKYFERLLFLLPVIQDEETMSDASLPTVKQEIIDSDENLFHVPSDLSAVPGRSEMGSSMYDDDKSGIDEDKMFLMSLVPCFRRMSESDKLETKMEFLKIMKKMLQRRHDPDDSMKPSTSHDAVYCTS